jgi:hypothetical protein
LHQSKVEKYASQTTASALKKLELYQGPLEEKYADLFEWLNVRNNRTKASEAKKLFDRIQSVGQTRELELIKKREPIPLIKSISNEQQACPNCHYNLVQNVKSSIIKGNLTPCTNCKALIWLKPKLIL